MGKNIIQAIGLLLGGAFISKIIGFIREILFIHKFGMSSVSDAYLLTCSIPDVFFTAVSIAINMNFIPMYMELKRDNLHNRFASNLLNICIIFSACVCLLIIIFPYHILSMFAFSLPEETLQYAIVMLRIVSVSIIPILMERLFRAYSQANENFFSTALLGIITNLVLIVTYLIATKETFSLLSVGFVAAQCIAMIMMFCNAKKVGFHYSPVLNFKDSSVINMLKLSVPLTVGQIAEEASVFVDRNLAAQVGIGVISAMAYAALLSKFTSSLLINAITTAIFPKFSQLISEDNKQKFVLMFWKYIQILNYVLCPLSIFLVLFSDDIVMILLHHGAIRESDAKLIWECASCYAIGIIPLGVQNYVIRGFYAFHETKLPTLIVVSSLLLNVILSIVLSANFAHIGIAIATSISYGVSAFGLIFVFIKKYEIYGISKIAIDFFSSIIMTILAGGGVYYLTRLELISMPFYSRVLIELFIFLIIYVIIIILKNKEMINYSGYSFRK